MKIDLHLHTTASDGLHAPLELLNLAIDAGLSTLSITDHESIEGSREVAAAAEAAGVRTIPGVELLVTYKGEEIHVLGYGMDLENQAFSDRLHELREARNSVALQTVHNLQKLGFPVTWEDVSSIAHPRGAVSKGHIVHAMHRGGLLKSSGLDFVRRYLDPAGLAHVEFKANSFDEGVELIQYAGGVPVIAHPALIATQSILPELVQRQPVGLEVFYSYYGPHREKWVSEYYAFARDRGLLMTGGSDYHGPFAPFKLGELDVPSWVLPELDQSMDKARSQYGLR